MDEIKGVTFPIPKKYMSRFFEENKTVFIKPATVFKEIKPGLKLVFYQSHENTGFVGEASIKRMIMLDDPLKFFGMFGNSIFLTKQEVKEYLEEQKKWQGIRVRKGETKKKKWMALELENIKKYQEPMKPKRFVPVGGQYIRE